MSIAAAFSAVAPRPASAASSSSRRDPCASLAASASMRGSPVYAAATLRCAGAARASRSLRLNVSAGNKNEGGLFAPIVIVIRDAYGVKEFNQLRGKAISLHSQVITDFCKSVGADSKVRQGLIRVAKSNGGKLGFLA